MRAEAKAKNDPKALAGKRREKAEREQYIYEVQGDEIDEEWRADLLHDDDLESIGDRSGSPLANPCQMGRIYLGLTMHLVVIL